MTGPLADNPVVRSELADGWPVLLSAMVGIGLGLFAIPHYTLGILAPELAREFGWSFGQIMTGFPILTLVILGASPVVGLLADRFGVRSVTLTSIVLFGLSIMAFGFANGDIRWYYLNWGLMAALGAGTLPITWTRPIQRRFEVHKGLALGIALAGTGLFGILVKPLAGWLIPAAGWRSVFFVIGALPLLLALPLAYFAFHDDRTAGRLPGNPVGSPTSPPIDVPGMPLPEAIRHWRFWVLVMAFVPISFAVAGAVPNLENILKQKTFVQVDIISLAQMFGLFVILGRIAGGWVIDRVWAPLAAFFLLMFPAAACWALAEWPLTYWEAAATIAALGVAAGMEYDLMAFLIARYFGLKAYGAIYGILFGLFGLGAGFGPVAYGLAFDRDQSYAGILHLCTGLLLLGATLLLSLGRYRFASVHVAQARHVRVPPPRAGATST